MHFVFRLHETRNVGGKAQWKLTKKHVSWLEFIDSFPYVIKYKRGKKYMVAKEFSWRCNLLTSLHTRLFGFEYMMTLRASDIGFVEVFVALEHKSFYQFYGVNGYFFKQINLCVLTKSCVNLMSYFLGALWIKFSDKVLFSDVCHSQSDGKIGVIGRKLTQLFMIVMQGKLKFLKDCMPFNKFVCRNIVYPSNYFYFLDIEYGFALIHLDIEMSFDSALVANVLMHFEIMYFSHWQQLEHWRYFVIEPGDWVWKIIHDHKKHSFESAKDRSRRIKGDAYKISLQGERFDNANCDVVNPSLLNAGQIRGRIFLRKEGMMRNKTHCNDSGSNPFVEREDDAKQLAECSLRIQSGQFMRAQAKKINETLIGLVQETWEKQLAIGPTNNEENVLCLIWIEDGATQPILGSKT